MLQGTNRFLVALDRELDLLSPHLERVELRCGQFLSEPHEHIKKVYFLHEGAASKVAVFEDGTEIECAFVGREGVIGAIAMLGFRIAFTRDVCHVDAEASCIDTGILYDACQKSRCLHDAFHHYCGWKMSCVIRNGACNGRHSIEQRLCRWLLTCSDVLERRDIPLSQDVFARMLGAQRTSINPILQRLRGAGLVALARSRLDILDRPRLVARACECYRAAKAAEEEFLRPIVRSR